MRLFRFGQEKCVAGSFFCDEPQHTVQKSINIPLFLQNERINNEGKNLHICRIFFSIQRADARARIRLLDETT